LTRRVTKFPTASSWISKGSETILWYFGLADELINSIVVRHMVKVPEEADADEMQAAVDDVIVEVHGVQVMFAEFAGNLLWDLLKAA